MTVCDPARLPASGKADGTAEAVSFPNRVVRFRHRACPLRGVVACGGLPRANAEACSLQGPAQFCAWSSRATSDWHVETECVGTNGSPRGYILWAYPYQEDAMAAPIPFLLSSVLLVASPGSEGNNPPGNNDQQNQNQQNQELTGAQAFSVAAGRILGAASACDQIDRTRV